LSTYNCYYHTIPHFHCYSIVCGLKFVDRRKNSIDLPLIRQVTNFVSKPLTSRLILYAESAGRGLKSRFSLYLARRGGSAANKMPRAGGDGNATVEIGCSAIASTHQAHIGRLMSITRGRTFAPCRDEADRDPANECRRVEATRARSRR
jgi:hypothetical protein